MPLCAPDLTLGQYHAVADRRSDDVFGEFGLWEPSPFTNEQFRDRFRIANVVDVEGPAQIGLLLCLYRDDFQHVSPSEPCEFQQPDGCFSKLASDGYYVSRVVVSQFDASQWSMNMWATSQEYW